MTNHYVEFEVRDGSASARCSNITDAKHIFDQWVREQKMGINEGDEIILVRIDTHEEVVECNA
jgi:hypothetical protein